MRGVWGEVQSFNRLGKRSGDNLEWKGRVMFICSCISGERLACCIPMSFPGTDESCASLAEATSGCPETPVHVISHFA